jgi:ParB family chromosome partitioning protein
MDRIIFTLYWHIIGPKSQLKLTELGKKELAPLFARVDIDINSSISRQYAVFHPDLLYSESQIRNDWDSKISKEALQELADDIDIKGVYEPIFVVAAKEDRYRIIDGERRWRASKLNGLSEIPCIVLNDLNDKQISILELSLNAPRKKDNPMTLATVIDKWMKDFDLTVSEMALKIGCSEPKVYKILKLMKISPILQQLALDGIATDPRSFSVINKMEPEQLKQELICFEKEKFMSKAQ